MLSVSSAGWYSVMEATPLERGSVRPLRAACGPQHARTRDAASRPMLDGRRGFSSGSSCLRNSWRVDPYAVLGLSKTADAKQIKMGYLDKVS